MKAQIIEYKPSKSLSAFVEWYWRGTFQGYTNHCLSQKVIPNGYVELIIHLTEMHCNLYKHQYWSQSPDYTIIGLYTQPYEVRFHHYVEVFAIRFKPEGIYNIFGVPAAEFKGSYEDMVLVLGSEFKDFSDRLRQESEVGRMIHLAESYLLTTLQRQQPALSYVNYAAEIIRRTKDPLKIKALAYRLNISQRQLEREFKHKIGITPKHYLRLSRMNEVHRLLEADRTLNLTKIAYQVGYTDQAHFIRDFKSITGEKPSFFVKAREQFIVNSKQAENLK